MVCIWLLEMVQQMIDHHQKYKKAFLKNELTGSLSDF